MKPSEQPMPPACGTNVWGLILHRGGTARIGHLLRPWHQRRTRVFSLGLPVDLWHDHVVSSSAQIIHEGLEPTRLDLDMRVEDDKCLRFGLLSTEAKDRSMGL